MTMARAHGTACGRRSPALAGALLGHDRLVHEGSRLRAPAPVLRSTSELGTHHCDDPAHATARDYGPDVRLSVATGGRDAMHRQPATPWAAPVRTGAARYASAVRAVRLRR
jgi:hypothetical protein